MPFKVCCCVHTLSIDAVPFGLSSPPLISILAWSIVESSLFVSSPLYVYQLHLKCVNKYAFNCSVTSSFDRACHSAASSKGGQKNIFQSQATGWGAGSVTQQRKKIRQFFHMNRKYLGTRCHCARIVVSFLIPSAFKLISLYDSAFGSVIEWKEVEAGQQWL